MKDQEKHKGSKYTIKEQIANAITWLKGLKTTKLPQGTGALGDKKDGYCCLGYGCKRLKIPFESEDCDSSVFKDAVGLITTSGSSNKYFVTTIKNEDYDPDWDDKDQEFISSCCLIDCNDDLKMPFRQISTFAIKNAKGFFRPKVAAGIIKHFQSK